MKELLGTLAGGVIGGTIGFVKGATIGIAVGGPIGAVSGAVPCAVAGAVTGASIGNNIGHIHIAFFHTDSIPFSPDTVSKIIDQINGIALDGGGDTESAGPCGKYTGSIIHTKDNFTVFISGV